MLVAKENKKCLFALMFLESIRASILSAGTHTIMLSVNCQLYILPSLDGSLIIHVLIEQWCHWPLLPWHLAGAGLVSGYWDCFGNIILTMIYPIRNVFCCIIMGIVGNG